MKYIYIIFMLQISSCAGEYKNGDNFLDNAINTISSPENVQMWGRMSQGAPANSYQQTGLVCHYTSEVLSGINKICYYDCLGSATAITIGSASLCPITINR